MKIVVKEKTTVALKNKAFRTTGVKNVILRVIKVLSKGQSERHAIGIEIDSLLLQKKSNQQSFSRVCWFKVTLDNRALIPRSHVYFSTQDFNSTYPFLTYRISHWRPIDETTVLSTTTCFARKKSMEMLIIVRIANFLFSPYLLFLLGVVSVWNNTLFFSSFHIHIVWEWRFVYTYILYQARIFKKKNFELNMFYI